MNDLRSALRQFSKAPGVTAIAVLTLALGIGANAVVFSWIQSILLKPLPGVRDGGQIVALLSTHGATMYHTVSPPDIVDYEKLDHIFAGVIGSQITPACMTIEGESIWTYGQIATANFFDVLGVQPLPGLGRTFLPEEGLKESGAPVLVLSEAFWRRQFAGDPAVIGRAVTLNQHSFTIVGVVPKEFRGTMSGLIADFWAPITMHREVANFGSLQSRTDRWLHTQARLQPGVTLAQAQAAATVRASQLAEAYPENREMTLTVLPMWKTPYGGQAIFLPALRILSAVGVVILLIVAANVANLLLARATARRRETAIRLALGAGRGRLIRQWLTESVLLALVGGAGGLFVTLWGATLFVTFMPETPLPAGYDFSINGTTLVFTLLLTIATGVMFGLAPAFQAARANLNDALKEGGRSAAGSAPHKLRSALVVAEVALALALLVGAGLCIAGFRRARNIDPGFDPHHTLIAGLRIGMNGYDEARGLVFYRQLRERLAQAPGVEQAGLASWFPLGFEGGPSLGITIEGYTPTRQEDMSIPYSIVSPGYFDAMRIPLLQGRDFTDRDDASAPGAVVINETMAQRFWPGENPIGRRFAFWGGHKKVEVVGVAQSGKYRLLSEPPQCFMYLPYQQGVWDLNLGVILRTAGDPRAMLSTLRGTVRALDPRVELWAALPMLEYVEAAFLMNRIAMTLLVALGVLALALAAMGIYGVMAYTVGQRVPEIGVRMALGARPVDVARMVITDGLRVLGIGLAIGLVLAWIGGILLAHFLPGVSSIDVTTAATVSLLLTVVSVVACWLPARRAAKVDPLIALRAE